VLLFIYTYIHRCEIGNLLAMWRPFIVCRCTRLMCSPAIVYWLPVSWPLRMILSLLTNNTSGWPLTSITSWPVPVPCDLQMTSLLKKLASVPIPECWREGKRPDLYNLASWTDRKLPLEQGNRFSHHLKFSDKIKLLFSNGVLLFYNSDYAYLW
jgi:hypothetical protein